MYLRKFSGERPGENERYKYEVIADTALAEGCTVHMK